MTTNVGANQSNTVGMNKTETITLNYTQSIGALKNVSVAGNFFTTVTGKLTEIIEGDVHSETKKGKTSINAENGIETSSNSSINRHAQTEVQNNSGEQSKNH